MARLPQPGGEQRDQTKFIVFENFQKLNTQSAVEGLPENELSWMENLQPIAPNKLVAVPAIGTITAVTTKTITLAYYADINGTDYFIIFTAGGAGFAYNINAGTATQFAADGTFSSMPDVTTWQASRVLIADVQAGYSTWDGTVFVHQGGVSPNITVTNPGAYSSPPTVTITGGSGHGATAIAILTNGFVTQVQLTNPGTNYLATDILTVTFSNPPGSGAAGHVVMSGSPLANITLQSQSGRVGSDGTFPVTITGGGGTGASATMTILGGLFSSVQLTAPGSGYTSSPSATSTGGGANWTFNTFLGNQTVASIVLDAGGSGYVAPPPVTIVGGSPFVQATAVATEAGGAVTALTLTGIGSYPPGVTATVVIGAVSGATANAQVWPFIPNPATLAVFQGRVWLGGGTNPQLLQWTGTGATYGNVGYDDFLAQDASGSLLITDADLVHQITALRSLNNYLFIMGDESVKQIGNISLDSTGLVTVFTLLTLSSDQGTIFPKSCISYNRVFLFASPNGIYGVFGSSVQKLSSDLDGIFANVNFANGVQGGAVDLNGIHNAVFLVTYNDPLEVPRPLLLIFDGKRWWTASQTRSINAIATAPSLSADLNNLYGFTNNGVAPLFNNTAGVVPITLRTSQSHHGNAVQGKRLIRAGVTMTAPGSTIINLRLYADGTPNPLLRNLTVPGGFALTGGMNDANNLPISIAGVYLGLGLNVNIANATVTNLIIEYQETTLWQGA